MKRKDEGMGMTRMEMAGGTDREEGEEGEYEKKV